MNRDDTLGQGSISVVLHEDLKVEYDNPKVRSESLQSRTTDPLGHNAYIVRSISKAATPPFTFYLFRISTSQPSEGREDL